MPPVEPETPNLLPDRPPDEDEAGHLEFLLRMAGSSFNRLSETNSPYALLVASMMDVLDAILHPDIEEA